jgi:hypothetical protein
VAVTIVLCATVAESAQQQVEAVHRLPVRRQVSRLLAHRREQPLGRPDHARACSHLNTDQRVDLNQSSVAAMAIPAA